jgi:hypothetical protein
MKIPHLQRNVYVKLSGGLGNQLFMFATALSLSKHWSKRLVLVDGWYSGEQRGSAFADFERTFGLAAFPKIASQFRVSTKLESKIILGIEKLHFSKKLDLTRLGIRNVDQARPSESIKPGIFLFGYMQEPQHFLSNLNELRDFIQLPSDLQKEAHSYISRHKNNGQRLIALHVRRGDYAHPDMFGCLLTNHYFMNALKHFNVNASEILIFSDSPEWCEQDPFFSQFHIVKEKSAAISLVLMTLCDDFVVSPSTFSWWAAWLGKSEGKVVVVPNPYNEFDDKIWEQLVMEGWIREHAIFEKSNGSQST